jgi:flavodoxin I
MATKLFYGSTNGNTERVAELIKEELGDAIDEVMNIADASPDDLASADKLILGTSTWQEGELQEDWEDFFPQLDDIDFGGKTVALFGLGDAYGYSGEFVNGLGTLGNKVKERGATIVGAWPTEGYDFEHSDAAEGDSFMGLVIDEDNDSDKTEERVKTWCEQIKGSF